MDPRTFLALAENLKAGPGAAEYRTAINRAYYAAFGFAVLVFDGIGLTTPAQRRATATFPTGTKITDLYRLRERADYEMGDASIETQQQAALAVGIARRVIPTLERVASATPEQKRALFLLLSQ